MRRALAAVVLAAVAVSGAAACGADPHLQRQEARQMALTCHSLVERDRVEPVPSVPWQPFYEVVRKTPPKTGGRTNRDTLARDLCPDLTAETDPIPFSFPWPTSQSTTAPSSTSTTTTTVP